MEPSVRFSAEVRARLRGDGVSLLDLLHAYLASNSSVGKALYAAESAFGADKIVYSDYSRHGTLGKNNEFWPVCSDMFDFKSEWMLDFKPELHGNPQATRISAIEDLVREGSLDAASFRKVVHAEALMKDLYDLILYDLRNGALEAYGVFKDHKEKRLVPVGIWSSPSIRMNFVENSIWRCTGSHVEIRPDDERMPFLWTERRKLYWDKIEIVTPYAEDIDDDTDPVETAEVNKGGRKGLAVWPEATFYLLIYLQQEGLPENGDQLATILCGCMRKAGLKSPVHSTAKKHLQNNLRFLWDFISDKKRNREADLEEIVTSLNYILDTEEFSRKPFPHARRDGAR